MTDPTRWTIPELLARYELEPQLADVFVEGTFDREVLSNVPSLTHVGYRFYEIDAVDVPGEILAKHSLSSGNKQRVIALARELAPLAEGARLLCLVDRDLDHWFGELESSAKLRWTIFCSLELHFLTPDVIRDVLITTGRIRVKQFDAFIDSLIAVLRTLYALRLTDRQCSMQMKWVALRKYLSRDGDIVRFDLDGYKTALLTTNRLSARRSIFDDTLSSWLLRLTCDVRQCSRGHDFQTLLAWAMNEFGGQKEFASETAIERLFVFMARSIPSLSEELQ